MCKERCIVIGAGDLTVGTLPVEEKDYVIAVDGGLTYCGVLQLEPDMIIGDFDSVSEGELQALLQLQAEIPERILRLTPEKDDTDMLVALKHGLKKGYRDFRIYAGTGGRLDHTIANIQCLLYLKKQGATGYLCDGTGMILVICNEEVSFRSGMEGYLSLFSLGREAKGVTIRGMKYPLDHYTMTNNYPIGISNEFIGEQAVICVEDGEAVCIVQWAEE